MACGKQYTGADGGLETETQRELERTGIIHRGDLAESGRRAGGVSARAEVTVAEEIIAVVKGIEGLGERFHPDSFADRETAAEAEINRKQVVANAGVTDNELPIHLRAGVPCTVVAPVVRLNGSGE